MRTLMRRMALTASLGAMLIGGTLVHAATALPDVHRTGPVEYLSGGVGLDESRAIESAGRQWPLTLEFAARDGQHADFLADVKVRVRDATGQDALEATSDGPFLLARLPPGAYIVDATLGGRTLRQNVVIRPHQPAKALFVWPADAAPDRS